MAFSPQTNAMYLPLSLSCEKATFGPTERRVGGGGTGPVRRRNYKHPASGGNLGEFQALDIRSGKTLWRHRTPSPINTAALATAGGVVFAGDWDRHVYAYDASTGKILWQTRLPTSAQGFPLTYLATGETVHRRAGRHRRRKLVDAARSRARPGDPPAQQRQLANGVRVAREWTDGRSRSRQ